MKNFTHALLGLVLAAAATAAVTGCQSNSDKDKELNELRQLAEMDRREMENQYAEFAAQYGEMKKDIKDDSLVARLDAEQRRAEALLKELQSLKTNSAAEILRLKKELATVRAVLRDYIRQVDSLQQINQALTSERDEARAEAARTRQENTTISQRNGVYIFPAKKNGKQAKKSKDITRFTVSFTITRNVTAATGMRTVYVRLLKPTQDVVSNSGTFQYENKNIGYSAVKNIEYTGEEQKVTLYVPVSEYLSGGTYTAYIFVDGQMIGSGSLTMKK